MSCENPATTRCNLCGEEVVMEWPNGIRIRSPRCSNNHVVRQPTWMMRSVTRPWHVEYKGSIYTCDGKFLASVCGDPAIEGDIAANAAVMAAAPELLAAAKAMLARLPRTYAPAESAALQAAIAKAEGRQP